MTQDKLIKDCINNNKKAQEELYRQYKDSLFSMCLKYCRNKTEAEDNLHDAFITIFEKIGNYKNKGSFEGWMKRITINKAIDKYKKERNTSEIFKTQIVDEVVISQDKFDLPLNIILKTIQELPNQYRLVFNLYELDNYSHKEIASMLSISIGTSKSNLHRAKVLLKTRIEELNQSNLKNKQ